MMLKTIFDLKKNNRISKQPFSPYSISGVKKEKQQTNSYKKSLINNIKTTGCHGANLF